MLSFLSTWDQGIFHKPQITNFVCVSNVILKENPTPDPYRDVLDHDPVELEDSEYLKHLCPHPIRAVAERVRWYKVC